MLSKLIAKFGAICWYCGVELDEVIHIDHIIPKCQGGANTLENRALTCKMCNLAKNRYPLSEFKNWLQYIKNSKFQPLI